MAFVSFLMDRITPIPSTCPLTKWPPKRPLADIARSKLTRELDDNFANVVDLKVSGITSTTNKSLVNEETVKHTPLTDILSPLFTSSKTVFARMVNSSACGLR